MSFDLTLYAGLFSAVENSLLFLGCFRHFFEKSRHLFNLLLARVNLSWVCHKNHFSHHHPPLQPSPKLFWTQNFKWVNNFFDKILLRAKFFLVSEYFWHLPKGKTICSPVCYGRPVQHVVDVAGRGGQAVDEEWEERDHHQDRGNLSSWHNKETDNDTWLQF